MVDLELALDAVEHRFLAAKRLNNKLLEDHALTLLTFLKLGEVSPDEAIWELEQVYK